MGIALSELKGMSLWELDCAQRAWMVAHGGKEPIKPPSDQAFIDWVTEWPTSKN